MFSNGIWTTSRGTGPRRRQMVRATIQQLPSVHALEELAPVAGLDPRNRLVAAVAVRPEHRGFAFADIEPVLAESIQDVRLMRDHDNIGACRRHGPGHLA